MEEGRSARYSASAKDGLDAMREETSARVRSELAGEIATMQRQHETLQKQLDLATQQLNVDGKSPALPADRVTTEASGGHSLY